MDNAQQPITADQRAEAMRLHEQATAGPWERCLLIPTEMLALLPTHAGVMTSGGVTTASTGPGDDKQSQIDAEFIAAARTFLPAYEVALQNAERQLAEARENSNIKARRVFSRLSKWCENGACPYAYTDCSSRYDDCPLLAGKG